MRTGKSKFLQPVLHIRNLHEQFPQQTRAIIFNHNNDRTLVNGQMTFCIPVMMNAEAIHKTVPAFIITGMQKAIWPLTRVRSLL